MKRPNDSFVDREHLDVPFDLTVSAGAWSGITKVNKYGYAPNGVQSIKTDIWDRADATPTQSIWVSPVVAGGAGVLHNISSTSNVDTLLGLGARQIQIYGLTDWDTKEVSEVIDMDGTNDVSTVNVYVIIHRMKVVSYGVLGPNVGTLTAINAAATVTTATILPNEGQTQMAIYGYPSVQTAYLTNWYASIHKASGTSVDTVFKLLLCIDPENAASQFIVKETRGLQSTGSSFGPWKKDPYGTYPGPGIMKIQAIGSANDIDAAAGFDLILVDK